MSRKEVQRLMLLEKARAGVFSLKACAEALCVSYRQAKWLMKRLTRGFSGLYRFEASTAEGT